MYSVKYSTTTPTGSLRKGNAVINIAQDNDGPTSTTGYYNGFPVPDGGYLVIQTNNGSSPAYFPCAGDNEIVNLARNKYGQTAITQARDAVEYFANLNDVWVLTSIPDEIVTQDLQLYIDPKVPSSYPATGTGALDLSGNGASGRLNNGVAFDSTSKTFIFDGADDFIDGPLPAPPTAPFTLEIVGRFDQATRNPYEYFGAVGNADGNYTMASISKIGTQSPYSGQHGHLYCYVGTNDLSGTDLPVTGSEYYHVTVQALEEPPFIRIWRNNVEGNFVVGEIPSQPINGATARFWYGTWSNSTWWLDGNIGSYKYYDRALTETERLQNYFGGKIVTDGLIFAIDPSNLVSYDGNSTITYSMTGSYTGSLQNGVDYRTDNGGVFYFDGGDDIIRSQNINPSAITVEIWKKWTTVSDDWLVTNQTTDPTDSTKGYYIRIDSPSYALRWYAGTTSGVKVAATTINLNEWYHVVGMTDTNGTKLYLNGIEVGSDAGGVIDYTGVQGLTIGAANDTSRATPGPVGPVRIYDRALTPEEVAQNFEAQKSKFGF